MEERRKTSFSIFSSTTLLFIAVLTNVVVIFWQIPQVCRIIKHLNVSLPLPTQLIIGLSSSCKNNILSILPLILLGWSGAVIWAFATKNKGRLASIYFKIAIALLIFSALAIACSLLPLLK